MTATRRKGHTRKVNGRTVKVRPHQVNHQQTAANLWAASGLPTLFNRHAGLGTLDQAVARARAGRRAAALAWGMAGSLQLGGWMLGRTSWALGLTSLALIFAGAGLLRAGYTPPRVKRKPAARKKPAAKPAATRPVHVFPDQPKPARRPPRQSRRASDEYPLSGKSGFSETPDGILEYAPPADLNPWTMQPRTASEPAQMVRRRTDEVN